MIGAMILGGVFYNDDLTVMILISAVGQQDHCLGKALSILTFLGLHDRPLSPRRCCSAYRLCQGMPIRSLGTLQNPHSASRNAV